MNRPIVSPEAEEAYERLTKRLREKTPSCYDPPSLSLVDRIFCEMFGDQQKQINDLKARIELPDQVGRMKK